MLEEDGLADIVESIKVRLACESSDKDMATAKLSQYHKSGIRQFTAVILQSVSDNLLLFRSHRRNGLEEPTAVRYPLFTPSPFVAIIFHFEVDARAIACLSRDAV
jgi:hypothetical protein